MAVLDITNRCNLSCSYCNRYMNDGSNISLEEPDREKIIEIIQDAFELGIKQIALQGGEPLLRSDLMQLIRDISIIKNLEHFDVKKEWLSIIDRQYTKTKFFLSSFSFMKKIKFPIISVTTNGTVYSDNLSEMFYENNVHLEVSLDTNQPYRHNQVRSAGKDTFGSIVNHIKKYSEKLPVVMKTTIYGDNVDQMLDMVDFAHKLGCIQIIIHPVKSAGKASDIHIDWMQKYVENIQRIVEYGKLKQLPIIVEIICPVNFIKNEEIYSDLKQTVNDCANLVLNFHSCLAYQTVEEIYIRSDLQVFGCPQLSHNISYSVGNLQDISLKDLVTLPSYINLTNRITERMMIPACAICQWIKLCRGGCAAADKDANWGQNLFDELCQFSIAKGK